MKKIPVTKPYFNRDEEKEVIEVLRSGWVVQGPKVGILENLFAKLTGAKYAVATNSCTSALHLALLLLGIGKGDEVIVPSFTFIATPNSVLYTGATPVFADVGLDTYNLDPKDVEAKITKRTKAIIPVHQAGLAAPMPEFIAIAKKHNLAIVEDAAHGVGARINGKHTGTFGDIACFSLHPRKSITTAEGGMLVTNNKDFNTKSRILRSHGMSISDRARHESKKFIDETYETLGYNYRMSDVHAAIGVAQFRKLDFILKKRNDLANRYNQVFSSHRYIAIPAVPKGYIHSYQSYVIRLEEDIPLSREEIMNKLLKKGISARIGIKASHLAPHYRKKRVRLKNAELLAKSVITLPLYPEMTHEDQDFVIDCLHEIVR